MSTISHHEFYFSHIECASRQLNISMAWPFQDGQIGTRVCLTSVYCIYWSCWYANLHATFVSPQPEYPCMFWQPTIFLFSLFQSRVDVFMHIMVTWIHRLCKWHQEDMLAQVQPRVNPHATKECPAFVRELTEHHVSHIDKSNKILNRT